MSGIGTTIRLVCIASLVLALSACSLRNVEPPELALVDLQPEAMTVFETSLLVTVRIDNVNPFPLEMSGGYHRIYINDIYIGRGVDSESTTIPKFGSATKEVTVKISNLSFATKIQDLLASTSLKYKIESTLYQDSLGFRSIKNTREGTLISKPNSGGSKNGSPTRYFSETRD